MAVDIPNYRVIEKLGVGAQTRVFRARCMRTGKDYTVKLVKLVKPEDATLIDLLRTEYAIGSTIDHPVIRKVYELRLMRQRLRVRGAILFMEYVEGLTLADKAFQRPLDDILRIFAEVARGLEAMHRAGYVHADLKPNNIMVAVDGTVKLIDLGQSAKIHEAKTRVQGTIDYMAPEQVQRGVLDHRTDVFGLGATLHKLLTGRAIKTEMNKNISLNSQGQIGRRVEAAENESELTLPSILVRLLEDCCHHKPEDRISSMAALAERLELARTIMARRPQPSSIIDDDEADDLDEDFDGDLDIPDRSSAGSGL
jgi:serine/threonine-protein kinase